MSSIEKLVQKLFTIQPFKRFVWDGSDITCFEKDNIPEMAHSFYWGSITRNLFEEIIEASQNADPYEMTQHIPEDIVLNENVDGCMCQGCGNKYKVDLIIPDDLWNRIKPKGKELGAGLLCGSCIMSRIENGSDFDYWKLVKE